MPGSLRLIRNWDALGFMLIVAFLGAVAVLILFALHLLFSGPYNKGTNLSSLSDTLRDTEFWRSVKRTLLYSLCVTILKVLLVWPIAAAFRRSRTVFAWSLLLPWIIPSAVSSLAWLWLFYDTGGGANLLVRALGHSEIAWLGLPGTAFAICMLFNVWRELPLWALALSPSLAGFRGSLASLATIDDLTPFQRFRLLVLPRAKPVLTVLIALSFIWASGEFESIWVLTRGGPGEATELLTVYAFRHSFLSQDISRGAAAYIVFTPIMALLLVIIGLYYTHTLRRALQ